MGRWWILFCGIALGAAAAWWARDHVAPAGDERVAGVARPAADDEAEAGADDDDDDDIPARVVVSDGRRLVVLDAAERALAGIEVATPAPGSVAPELHVVGTVADGAALVAAQAALAAAQAQRDAAATTRATLRARLERLRALSADAAVGVARERADLELGWRREEERALTLETEVARLAQALQAGWGGVLTTLTAPGLAQARALAAGDLALVEFVLPAAIAAPPAEFVAAADGRRADARGAHLAGPAPRVPQGSFGRGWWALVEQAGLARGERVDLWLAQAARRDGVVLPATAVVWHGGRRWYFAALDDDRFERRPVPPDAGTGDTVLLSAAAAATPVVVQGAQVLLAEEFRGAIPDEDED
ncbi:MAG: hypothetical protein H6977_19140 [Gammaproteobacteria bacterium]|nr:hypothetical protein [Gammaproteobacteria bacterium]